MTKEDQRQQTREFISKQVDVDFMRAWLLKMPSIIGEKIKTNEDARERLEFLEGLLRDRIKELTS